MRALSISLLLVLSPAALSAAMAAPSKSGSSASGWTQTDQTDDGITAYRREVPGSRVVAFRGHGVVDAPLALVTTIIFDCRRGPEWIEDLKESRALRWLNSLKFIEYDHVGTPFVMKDRDFVTRVTVRPAADHHRVTISYKSVDDPSAPRTDYVRGDMIHADFTLTSIDHGRKTDVDADIHCDPKGSVPKWIVNYFQGDWPISTFRNLRKEARKPGISVDPRLAKLQ